MSPAVSGIANFLSDMPEILTWWACLLLLGAVFTPFCLKLFPEWPDKGFAFSRPLGILVGSYVCWLLASIGICEFSRLQIFCVVSFFFCAGVLLKPFRQELAKNPTGYARTFFLQEIGFLCLLLLGIYVRGHNPDIQDLEKFMDFGFINSCLRSPTMPPPDPWFAGETINYYYFGHFAIAWLIKFSGLAADHGYNLAVATLFAMTFTMSYSLICALVFSQSESGKSNLSFRTAGLIAAVLVACGGNMHAFWKWFLPLVGIGTFASKPFYYPDSTRFIGSDPPLDDKTIHEFPSYSFIVSDLHGHLNNLPFVLLFIALLFAGWQKAGGRMTRIPLIPYFLLYALLFAVFSMTNPWDVPVYLILSLLTIPFSAPDDTKLSDWLKEFLLRAVVIATLFPLFASPFAMYFKSFSHGIGLTHSHTPVAQFLILWGGHLIFAAAFIVWRFFSMQSPGGLRGFFQRGSSEDRFCLAMIVAALCLLAVPELIFIRDIYDASFYRANTMFKFTYQAFILLSLAAGYVFVRVPSAIAGTRLRQIVYAVFLATGFTLILYAFPAVYQRNGSAAPPSYKGLSGLNFLASEPGVDLQFVTWLQNNAVGQPVILEAPGESYSDHARISMATGLPTLIGWDVHERLWRDNEIANAVRIAHAGVIYEYDRPQLVLDMVRQYNIHYIVVGPIERRKYPRLRLQMFDNLFKRVVDLGEYALYSTRTEKITDLQQQ